MVLLKSIKNSSNNIVVTLSTFHYGSIKIDISLSFEHSTMKSTFHYGSIKIIMKNLQLKINHKSTFHYGSIKIHYKRKSNQIQSNLHSTMVLLK